MKLLRATRHVLSKDHPGQKSNLATAYHSAADLLPRLPPIHARCHKLTNAAQKVNVEGTIAMCVDFGRGDYHTRSALDRPHGIGGHFGEELGRGAKRPVPQCE